MELNNKDDIRDKDFHYLVHTTLGQPAGTNEFSFQIIGGEWKTVERSEFHINVRELLWEYESDEGVSVWHANEWYVRAR